ncbi:MAG: thermonuclease family protein [Pseudomonadota bacterium]
MVSLSGCSPATPLPGMEPGEQGRVVRVIDGDALVLDTGQSVRLVAIEAPALRPRGRAAEPYAEEAARALEDMALGREVRLYYPGLTRDRYDRALAHVVTIDDAGPDRWLNMDLIARGAARVRFYPDTLAMSEAFLAAEARARTDRTGLWSLARYRVGDAAQLQDGYRGFAILNARLAERRGRAQTEEAGVACLREIESRAIKIKIRDAASEICEAPAGSRFRLRGWISGGYLELAVSAHAEAL